MTNQDETPTVQHHPPLKRQDKVTKQAKNINKNFSAVGRQGTPERRMANVIAGSRLETKPRDRT